MDFQGHRQVECFHRVHEFGFALAGDARVELLFLADAADAPALVVVAGIHQHLIIQCEQLLRDAAIKSLCAAALEVGAPTPHDQQRVAGGPSLCFGFKFRIILYTVGGMV